MAVSQRATHSTGYRGSVQDRRLSSCEATSHGGGSGVSAGGARREGGVRHPEKFFYGGALAVQR